MGVLVFELPTFQNQNNTQSCIDCEILRGVAQKFSPPHPFLVVLTVVILLGHPACFMKKYIPRHHSIKLPGGKKSVIWHLFQKKLSKHCAMNTTRR